MAKGEGGVEEVEMVKPSCFCKLNCEVKKLKLEFNFIKTLKWETAIFNSNQN